MVDSRSLACIIGIISTGSPRPFVPHASRRMVFDTLHGLSHPGIKATSQTITARYVWPNIHTSHAKSLHETSFPCFIVRSSHWGEYCSDLPAYNPQHYPLVDFSLFRTAFLTFNCCPQTSSFWNFVSSFPFPFKEMNFLIS